MSRLGETIMVIMKFDSPYQKLVLYVCIQARP
jgi:hypothetical protein